MLEIGTIALTEIIGTINAIGGPTLIVLYSIFLKCNLSSPYALLKFLTSSHFKRKTHKHLLESFKNEIDEFIKNAGTESEKCDLKNLKNALNQRKSEIRDITKMSLLSSSERQDILIPQIENDLLNYRSLSKKTKSDIINQFERISYNVFKEYALKNKGQYEIEVLSSLSNIEKSFKITDLEIYTKIAGNEIKLDEIEKKISELKTIVFKETLEKYPSSFAELFERIQYTQVDLCEIYSSLNFEELSKEITNKRKEQIQKLQVVPLSDGIYSSIQRGNISQETETLKKITDLAKINNNCKSNLDIIYWMADIFHLVDRYDLAYKCISKCDKYQLASSGLNNESGHDDAEESIQ